MLIHWFDDRAGFTEAAARLRPMATAVEARLAEGPPTLEGYCSICAALVRFEIVHAPAGQWTDLREGVVCPSCRMNGRMRLISNALQEAGALTRGRFRILERVTPMFVYLQGKYPGLRGSEFVKDGAVSGSLHRFAGIEVEHQDFLRLYFADDSLDLLVHGDVLEHVPDHRQALREAARVVALGGQMIFTAPFYDLDQHIVRCRLEGGRLEHVLPPAYHGNPVSSEGSLVFIHPGWPLLDEMRAAGFAKAQIGICYDPYQGIVGNNNPYPDGYMWPVIFRAFK